MPNPLSLELFSSAPGWEPLASRMRPRSLDDFIGQEHILGEGRLLRRAIALDQLSSILLTGPPGTGKTTLAQVIARTTQSRFFSINAVLAGVKDVRDIIASAEETRKLQGQKSVLFVDEVHRWNKTQQDALLPWVENGTLILIGATTENPFFEVNRALVSRSRVFQLKALEAAELRAIGMRALADLERGYGRYRVVLVDGVMDHLVAKAGGDARNLLNALELAIETRLRPPPAPGTEIVITLAEAEESIQERVALYDKDGDYHYDAASAFIKSLRGSDPDAALYWMAVMVRAGEDPAFIFRRMLISACEDVGLADPDALGAVQAAAAAFDRVGMPEGQFHLAFAALRLALAPKSNSTLGYFDALKAVETEGAGGVPPHLKDASRDGDAFGHGKGYVYPHAYKDHWVAQNYLPAAQKGRVFYQAGSLGWEREPAEVWQSRRELAEAALPHSETDPEHATWSPGRGPADNSAPTAFWKELRVEACAELRLHRTSRLWVARDRWGLVAMEALRRCREGLVLVSGSHDELEVVAYGTRSLSQTEKPVLLKEQETPHRQKLDASFFLSEAQIDPEPWLRLLKDLEWSNEGRAVLVHPLATDSRLAPAFPGGFLPAEVSALLVEAEAFLPQPAEPPPIPQGWKRRCLVVPIPLFWDMETRQRWLDPTREGKWAWRLERNNPQTWKEVRATLMRTEDTPLVWERHAIVDSRNFAPKPGGL